MIGGPRFSAVLLCGLLYASSPAGAQSWQVFRFADAGFAVQLPAQPEITKSEFRTADQIAVPSETYALKQDDVQYAVTVADFTQHPLERTAALDEAVKAYQAAGEIKVNVEERIDRQFGRELSLVRKDGARSAISIFYVNNRLYELEGMAMPPRPEAGSGKTLRFQQSLEFIGMGDEAFRPENRPQGGRFGRRPLPPEAFEACRGKQAGDAVQQTLPFGVVDATCIETPGGLAARPNRRPPGAPGAGGPP